MILDGCQSIEISIHAPARGATAISGITADSNTFQSTLPRGERHRHTWRQQVPDGFQSTLPRGERRKGEGYGNTSIDFNPRSREGSDL